nr:hypothetical protein [Vitreoscilla filiformis]
MPRPKLCSKRMRVSRLAAARTMSALASVELSSMTINSQSVRVWA